jgi:two-component system response regulator MprA
VRILVVEDDPSMQEALRRALALEGHAVDVTGFGRDALALIRTAQPDALILDRMLPDIDGIEVCERVRSDVGGLPILMLTARDGIDDRVSGLDAGADDYLVKPFALDELLARVRALLRRVGGEGGREVLAFADLELDTGTFEARRGGRRLELTPLEWKLLELLLRNPRRVLVREVILDRVWGSTWGPLSNSLEVYVGHLRRKLEAGGEGRLVHTVRSVGYVLRESPR